MRALLGMVLAVGILAPAGICAEEGRASGAGLLAAVPLLDTAYTIGEAHSDGNDGLALGLGGALLLPMAFRLSGSRFGFRGLWLLPIVDGGYHAWSLDQGFQSGDQSRRERAGIGLAIDGACALGLLSLRLLRPEDGWSLAPLPGGRAMALRYTRPFS